MRGLYHSESFRNQWEDWLLIIPAITSNDGFTHPAALDMSKSWADGRFNGTGGRTRAITLLQRYSFSIGPFRSIPRTILADVFSLGDSASEFIAVRFESALAPMFRRLTQSMYKLMGPAFVVLNDELPESVSDVQLRIVHDAMSSFMNTTWPEKVRFVIFFLG